MILQCDQCNTKFRLDDSKLKPGGVKVRCSKCRHVFVAGAESKQEESDFDALLSGLGASAAAPSQPAAGEEAAPAPASAAAPASAPTAAASAAASATAAESSDFPDFDFTPEPAAAKTPAAPAMPADDFSFEFSAPEPAKTDQPQTAADSTDLDFGDLSFNDEAPALKEEPASAGFDIGDFDFSTEPAAEAAEQKPAELESDLGFGEFDFDSAPPVKRQEAAASDLDFGEFAFNEEPAAQPEAPAAAGKDDFDFGDVSFNEEPVVPAEAPAAGKDEFDFADFAVSESPAASAEVPTAAKEDFDFEDFSFTEGAALKPETPAAKEDFDFGDFSVTEEPASKAEEPGPAKGDLDFGDFSFSEASPAKTEETSAGKGEFDFSDFSFSEEPPPIKEEPPAEENFDDFFTSAPKASKQKGAPSDDVFAEGFSFDEEKEAAPAVAPLAAAGVATAADVLGHGAAPGASAEPVPPVSPVHEPVAPARSTDLDFSFGGKPGAVGGEPFGEEDELPPLSITSRRKGRSAVSMALAGIALVVVVAVTGAGLYLLQSGPAALAAFDKVGLGFVGKWFGIEAPDEGKITAGRPVASFYQNKEAGELFVVTGQAVNNFKKARASIHVKVSIFDKKGAVIMQKTAYCGNKLSKDQLETLPMAKIDQIMNNQFGDSLSNLGVKPGESIGYVVALANVPKDAADFGVEVLGSTVAGQ
ncbi:DUF3426 domain-containing protein [Geomonas sp.]|uniref:DUF3426 domain-containing protein n=1 Tax=Geomonas sp. TaxID=2651584 RepID=UPI002B4A3A62|nr:DUF3426 domain-containing protein [Geomonas sp.]HJV36771.1 DUF3426 domain-containing protein [Geomonas sp.]